MSTRGWCGARSKRPGLTVVALIGVFVLSLGSIPLLGLSFFPRTDAGQFTINLKAPTGTRIELTNDYVAKVEDSDQEDDRARQIFASSFRISAWSTIFFALYTTNSGSYTATIQTQLTDDHKISSYEYMDRVQQAIDEQFPELRTFFQSGSMVDAVLNTGMPAPIDVQVTSPDLPGDYALGAAAGGADLGSCRQRRAGLYSAGHGLSRRCAWTSTACTPPNSA